MEKINKCSLYVYILLEIFIEINLTFICLYDNCIFII